MSPQRFITLGKLRLVAGEFWESPGNMLLRASSRWVRSPREVLYVLIALGGPPLTREPWEGAAAAALANELFRAPGSVTARLRRAVEAANRPLYSENEKSYPKGKWYGGVVCLLLRSNEAYLAQVGPPRVYLSQAGKLQSYASRESEPLLGQQKVEASLCQLPLTADARILLTNHQWKESALEEALAESDVKDAWESVVALAPTSDSSAWLIGPLPEVPEAREREQGITPQARQMIQVAPSVAQVRLRQVAAPRWRRLTSAAGKVWRWISRASREIGEGVLPGPMPVPETWRSEKVGTNLSTLMQPYLLPVALGIPLLVMLLTGLLYWRTQVAGSTEFTSYLCQAQEALSIAAQPYTDESAARVYLQSALAQIDAALALRPGRKDAQKLREEVQRQLDLLNQITRLTFIRTLYEYPPQSEPGRILEAQDIIYVLDRGTNRVYRHRLDWSSQPVSIEDTGVVLQEGQGVGGKTVGILADMAWSPGGGTELLLILDQEGGLWGCAPGSRVQLLTLPGLDITSGAGWRLASYGGRLYVLAPKQGQVLRYSLEGDGFGLPEDYFPSVGKLDLSGTTDIAIDGHIYLLCEKGLVHRFLTGQEQPLPIVLPDAPLGRTPALFARPDEEAVSLYIVDAEQRRVVQLSKKGELIRQLKTQDPGVFTHLRGLFVDEAQGRLFVTDGSRLLLAEVPPLPTSQ